MQRFNARRILGVAALGAASAGAVAMPASAQEAPAETVTVDYAASAGGEALALSVFGETLSIGRTTSSLDSTVAAAATGLGIATPLFEGGVTSAAVSSEGAEGTEDEVCELDLQEIPGLGISLACSASLASVIDGLPSSLATGRVGAIRVNPLQGLLDTPLSAIVEPVADGAEDGVGQLVDGLRPVTSGIDENLDLGLEDTIDDLFGALFGGADLVTIQAGMTRATSTAVPGTVGSRCSSAGGRVDVLDLPAVAEGVDPPPVISLVIGDAGAAVDVDTVTGTAVPTVNPAIVTVIVPSMGIEQAVGPGQSIDIPLPEPLGTSTIRVADGVTGVDEDGNTFATANAVFIDLLNGEAMMGGIELGLASCSALSGAVVTRVIPEAPVEPTPSLPRTGGGAPDGLLLFGMVGLAGTGFALLRRSSTI